MPFKVGVQQSEKSIATRYKSGRTRSAEDIEKQRATMIKQCRKGLRFIPTKPKGIKDVHARRICIYCNQEYIPTSARQKWCFSCVPNNRARRIMQRYSLSNDQYNNLFLNNNGMCWICLKRKAKVVDHCHNTNKVRGLLCHHCNTALSLNEDKESLERAVKYVTIS